MLKPSKLKNIVFVNTFRNANKISFADFQNTDYQNFTVFENTYFCAYEMYAEIWKTPSTEISPILRTLKFFSFEPYAQRMTVFAT